MEVAGRVATFVATDGILTIRQAATELPSGRQVFSPSGIPGHTFGGSDRIIWHDMGSAERGVHERVRARQRGWDLGDLPFGEGFYECTHTPRRVIQTTYYLYVDSTGYAYEFRDANELQRVFFQSLRGRQVGWRQSLRLFGLKRATSLRQREDPPRKELVRSLDRLQRVIDREIVEEPKPPPPPPVPKKVLTSKELDAALVKAMAEAPDPQGVQSLDFDLSEFLKTL